MIKYKVKKDTREKEKHGWIFPVSDQCLGTEVETLKTGDYTLEGYEKILTIERKGTSGEFAQNIVQSRFEKELIRLEEFEQPFIILEFELEDVVNFPQNSGIPEKICQKLRITPQFYLKKINELQLKYRTKFVFAGKRGREFASSLFKRVVEKYGIIGS